MPAPLLNSLAMQIVVCAILAALPAEGEEPGGPPPPREKSVAFAQRIASLLKAHCLKCHGPAKAENGLRLDSFPSLTKGGYSGAVVRPGNSAESRLIHVVAGTDDDGLVMPPEPNARLADEQIALLRAWIDQGAKWPDGVVLAADSRAANAGKQSRHWAFQPLRRPEPPPVKSEDWVRNAIDRFVLARLESAGVGPSPAADRATLIRRVTLDLTGLPPAPGEIASFLNDCEPDAYERLVDRLLASPHYGEKWARHWLDLSHYADTDGYLTDQVRPAAWRYRDWLIDALNRDLTFDRFTIEQLAGDLLPQATTEQRIATGFLRNTLSNREGGADLEEYRVEQVVDRAQTVGTTWLGLTVGCARCHDHKFDPISQVEFYQLYAFFDGAAEVNIDAPRPGELERYVEELPEYDRRRRELIAPVREEIELLQTHWEQKLRDAVLQPGKDPLWDRQWELLGLTWGGENMGEGQLEGTQILLREPARRTRSQKDRLLDYFLERGRVVDPQRFDELKLDGLHERLAQLKKDFSQLTRAQTIQETDRPREAYVHVRGSFRRRGVAVTPGTPAFLPPLDERAAPDRLALGSWLVSPTNPLPARVTVNRFWQEFFERGLVVTSDNFGIQGAPPSHPELLDWLATEFHERGWSMKAVHRLIVTSATYRQSSQARPELWERDPNSALLARQAPVRFSAEQVRDATLAVGGLLDRRIGGPSVFPPQPASVAMEGFQNKWKASEKEDQYRRGLYTFMQRLSPFAQSVTFDAPSMSRSCSRRERSNTPLQALTLLNDPAFFAAAQQFAARVLRESAPTVDDRIDHAFRLALSRPPRPEERARLAAYYNQQLAALADDTDAPPLLAAEGAGEVPRAEAAAWTCACTVMLNLHEFITRD
ncbi:MAG: PSD1 domain-containing protein [Planctomycetia bacterium]|nr:PSD1 domain-containing protein [Planctomycetia bacterium]